MKIETSDNGEVKVFQYEVGVYSGETRAYSFKDFLAYYSTFRDRLETFWFRITKLMPSQTGVPVEYKEPVFNPELNYSTLGDFLSDFGKEFNSDIRLIRLMKSNFEGIFTDPLTGSDDYISRPVSPRSAIKHENLWGEFCELVLVIEEFNGAVMGILFSEGSKSPPKPELTPKFKDFFQNLCVGTELLIDSLFRAETAVMSICFSNEPDPIVGPSVELDFRSVPDPGSIHLGHKIVQNPVKVIDVTPKIVEGPEVKYVDPIIVDSPGTIVESPMTITHQPETVVKVPGSVSLKDLGIDITDGEG